jgi:hypothetical protein
MLQLGQHWREQFFQSRLQLPSPRREFALGHVPHAGYPSRFFNHQQMFVKMNDPQIAGSDGTGQWLLKQLDHILFGNPTSFIQAQVAVNLNLPFGNPLFGCGPTGVGD